MRFKQFQQDDLQLRLVQCDQAKLYSNWCLKGRIGYLVEGEVEIDVAGKLFTYTKGDVILLPEDEEHKYRHKVLTEITQFFAVDKVSWSKCLLIYLLKGTRCMLIEMQGFSRSDPIENPAFQ